MFDIYETVTDRIIAELESGIIPWDRPWTGVSTGAIRRSDGRPYSLINQMLLGKPGEWLTYKRAQEEGGNIRKGAKARIVVFWKVIHREKKDASLNVIRDENGLPIDNPIPMLRYYNVFHIDDCEGIKPKYIADRLPATATPIERADEVIADYQGRAKLTIEHGKQNEAFYSPSRHVVSLPIMDQFEDAAGYYGTAFHELTHSTGHKSLLNRFAENAAPAAFGSESYSREELVAEIGSCAILHELGIETEKSFRNNAAYIQSWLAALKNDKKLVVSAAGCAEKAVRLIMGTCDKNDEEG